ncbi:hypothetical protein HDU67_003688 [Dinochytrium kinnereticum]|nr:hypothetical protein HDU67_003688 [Dinochytrium kinnereticum]
MITMLGSGMALLLAFRTNRGFERYNNGAQLWINLGSQIRHAGRCVWNGVSTHNTEDADEKILVMKMLYGVAVATKHSLRGHDPLTFDDVQTLITPKPPQTEIIAIKSAMIDPIRGLLTKRPASLSTSIEGLDQVESVKRAKRMTRPSVVASAMQGVRKGSVINTPLDILYKSLGYVKRQKRVGNVDSEEGGMAAQAISGAIDSVTKFEQLLYVPVPRSYDVHIKQILILYFLSLPFQLVRQHGWATIFVSFVGSLTFFGTDAIAGEISDPFGSDQYDLPLDYFCKKLREDLEVVMGRPFDFVDAGVPAGDHMEWKME